MIKFHVFFSDSLIVDEMTRMFLGVCCGFLWVCVLTLDIRPHDNLLVHRTEKTNGPHYHIGLRRVNVPYL